MLQTQASDATLGYRFTVPEGFVDFPQGRASSPDLVQCWAEDGSAATKLSLVLCVQRLHGVIGRDKMKADEIPVGAQFTNLRWREFDLQGVRALAEGDEGPTFSLVAAVPLKPEAIQLLIAGPAEAVERGDSVMQATIASLQGQSNWLTRAERSERLGKSVGAWLSIAFAVGLVLYIRKRRAAA